MGGKEELDRLLYISLPEDFHRSIGDFSIDPSIMLPVEVPPGMGEVVDFADLSWEMIISAMLKILAWNPDHSHANYFRSFILALQPDIVSTMTEAAIVKAKRLDFDLAEELFLALSRLDPQEEKTPLNLALLYEQQLDLYVDQGRIPLAEDAAIRAINTYEKALVSFPQSPGVHFNAGYFFLKLRKLGRAKMLLSGFLTLAEYNDPRKPKVEKALDELESNEQLDRLFHEAFEAIKEKHEKEGIEKIKSFLSVRPEVWSGWFLLGWALRRSGDYTAGKKALYRALELEEKEVDIYNELAICLMELGEYDQCRVVLEKARAIEPKNVKIISNIAILELKTDNTEEAQRCFREILKIDPQDPLALYYAKDIE